MKNLTQESVNIAQTVAELALAIGEPRNVFSGERQRVYVLVPQADGSSKVEFIEAPDKPARAKGHYVFDTVESFIAFVNGGKSGSATIYARQTPANTLFRALAVLNEQDKDAPTFRDFRASVEPPYSESYNAWSGHSGVKFAGNEELAEFLEDRLDEIIEPTGATMMELVTNFHVKADVSYGNPVNLPDGSQKLQVTRAVSASAGAAGNIVIPKILKVRIPILKGEEETHDFTAHFRYRLGDGGKLSLWYQFIRPDLVVERAYKDALDRIATQTGVKVLLGVADFEVK